MKNFKAYPLAMFMHHVRKSGNTTQLIDSMVKNPNSILLIGSNDIKFYVRKWNEKFRKKHWLRFFLRKHLGIPFRYQMPTFLPFSLTLNSYATSPLWKLLGQRKTVLVDNSCIGELLFVLQDYETRLDQFENKVSKGAADAYSDELERARQRTLVDIEYCNKLFKASQNLSKLKPY